MAVRIPRAILLAPLAALASHGAASGASGPACDARGAVTGVIARFGDRLEPVLADGRTLRPLGLDPADRGPADSARLAAARRDLDATYGGATIQFRAIGGKADRWGRVPALIFLGDPPRPLAAEIVGLGDARARPETGALNCMAALLAA
ncbi:MAG: hypothetical protein KGQ28_08405, partial [Hyphomicrobiales bacterium]|nr:hypothetical protein [Hyphomicrobiales bacterium]